MGLFRQSFRCQLDRFIVHVYPLFFRPVISAAAAGASVYSQPDRGREWPDFIHCPGKRFGRHLPVNFRISSARRGHVYYPGPGERRYYGSFRLDSHCGAGRAIRHKLYRRKRAAYYFAKGIYPGELGGRHQQQWNTRPVGISVVRTTDKRIGRRQRRRTHQPAKISTGSQSFGKPCADRPDDHLSRRQRARAGVYAGPHGFKQHGPGWTGHNVYI